MTEVCRSNCSKTEEASQSKPPRETLKGGFGYLSQILISIPIIRKVAANVLASAYAFYLLTYILTDFPARVNHIGSGDPFYSSYISVFTCFLISLFHITPDFAAAQPIELGPKRPDGDDLLSSLILDIHYSLSHPSLSSLLVSTQRRQHGVYCRQRHW